jgi:hypothetical protein
MHALVGRIDKNRAGTNRELIDVDNSATNGQGRNLGQIGGGDISTRAEGHGIEDAPNNHLPVRGGGGSLDEHSDQGYDGCESEDFDAAQGAVDKAGEELAEAKSCLRRRGADILLGRRNQVLAGGQIKGTIIMLELGQAKHA